MRIAIALCVGLMATSATADDVGDVNAAADRFQAAFNENSAEAAALFAADGMLAFFDPVPLLNDGKEAFKQFLAGQFELTESVKWLPVGPRTTRVTGGTAVIGQNMVYVWKPVDGGAESMFVNSMQVWAKIGTEWMLTGIMTNALPHGSAP